MSDSAGPGDEDLLGDRDFLGTGILGTGASSAPCMATGL